MRAKSKDHPERDAPLCLRSADQVLFQDSGLSIGVENLAYGLITEVTVGLAVEMDLTSARHDKASNCESGIIARMMWAGSWTYGQLPANERNVGHQIGGNRRHHVHQHRRPILTRNVRLQ